MVSDRNISRRRVIGGLVSGVAVAAAGPALGAELMATPRQNEGPYYPFRLPLDRDNDLVRVAGRAGTARGEPVHLVGRVLDTTARPVPGVQVEIWQCDALGHYHHVDRVGEPMDPDFQGYGKTVAGKDGAYRFHTIKPVPYTGRTPHIHFAVTGTGMERLTTQLYLMGHPQNADDFLFYRLGGVKRQDAVSVEFNPAPALGPGAVAGHFDIVLGGNTSAG